jgi:hypothetical protein
MVWVRNDAWWGKDVFGKLPGPKYIVDIVNGSITLPSVKCSRVVSI